MRCRFRPEPLACKRNQDPETCLTITQIETLHKIHADYYETNQTYIFGGFYPGSESGLFDMGLLGPQLNPLGVQFYQYWVTKLSDSQKTFIFYHLLTDGDRPLQ